MDFNIFFWLKIAILIVLAGYSIFAFIIINQIRIMQRVIKQPSSMTILSVAILNFIFGVSLFLVSLVIL